jgi:hypothetical protein
MDPHSVPGFLLLMPDMSVGTWPLYSLISHTEGVLLYWGLLSTSHVSPSPCLDQPRACGQSLPSTSKKPQAQCHSWGTINFPSAQAFGGCNKREWGTPGYTFPNISSHITVSFTQAVPRLVWMPWDSKKLQLSRSRG